MFGFWHKQQRLVGWLRRVLNRTGLRQSRRVVFLAPTQFHLEHLLPVLRELDGIRDAQVDVVDVEGRAELSGFTSVRRMSNDALLSARWAFIDFIVATDFNVPWWFRSGDRGFLNHGVGPKAGYQERIVDLGYTHVFSAGPNAYRVQAAFLDSAANSRCHLLKTGLPAVDRFSSPTGLEHASEPDGKPVLLYAPSWHRNPAFVSMDKRILRWLGALTEVHVLIRPHPNLLKPEMCEGMRWVDELLVAEKNGCSLSLDGSVYDILPNASIIVGDLSSVMYEFAIMDRPGILYASRQVLTDALFPGAADDLERAFHRVESEEELRTIVSTLLTGPDSKRVARREVIDDMFYNFGSAARIAALQIKAILWETEDRKSVHKQEH